MNTSRSTSRSTSSSASSNASSSAVERLRDYLFSLQERVVGDSPLVILSAVSGGLDSLTLLLLLKEVEKKYGSCTVSAAHVVHNFQESKEQRHEIEVVDAMCHALAIPLHRKEIKGSSYREGSAESYHRELEPAESGGRKVHEAMLREMRYACLYEIAQEQKIPILATGHHRDDQYETLVLRIFRKDGIRGLAGIPRERWFNKEKADGGEQYSGILIRPLLELRKKELEEIYQELCLALGIKGRYHQDKSNFQERFLRNKLRLRLLPVLEELFPYARSACVFLADQMRQLLWDSGQRPLNKMLSPPQSAQVAQSAQATKGIRVSRTAYPWFVFDGGLGLCMSRFHFDRCSKTRKLHLLYLAANHMGLTRVSLQSLSLFANSELSSHSSVLAIQNTVLRVTQSFLLWERNGPKHKSKKADEPDTTLDTTTVLDTMPDTELTPELVPEIVDTDMCFVFENMRWTAHRSRGVKESPCKKGVLRYVVRYNGTLQVKRVTKHDTIRLNGVWVNVRDALSYEKEKACIILYDSKGVLVVPGESFLKRTLIRDVACMQDLEESHNDAAKKTSDKKISYCSILISYHHVGIEISK